MAYTAAVLDSQIDVSDIRDLLVQGDTAFPTINFTLPAGFTGLTWRVRGTFMQFNLATQSGELTATGSTTISIAWPVGSNFTTYYGEMQIVLVGTDALGNIVTKATGYVNVQRDYSISTVEIVDENLFEQLMAELSSSAVMLDQTDEQTMTSGVLKLAADRVISDDHHIVDKKHVADAVAAVAADDFNHNDLTNKQGGTANEYYHMTSAQIAALHAHSNKTALDAVRGTNTGDQDVSGAISTHNTDGGAHADQFGEIGSLTTDCTANLLDKYSFKPGMKLLNTYGVSTPNDYDLVAGDHANWTVLNTIVCGTGTTKNYKTNISKSYLVVLGYKLSGGKWVRESYLTSAAMTLDVDGNTLFTMGSTIGAIRAYATTAQIPASPIMSLAAQWDVSDTAYIPSSFALTVARDFPKFYNKKITGIGDSIMAGLSNDGGVLKVLKDKYPLTTIVNLGVGSTTFADDNDVPANVTGKCIYNRMDDIAADSDYIILQGGLNDYYHASTYSVAKGVYLDTLAFMPIAATWDGAAYANVASLYEYGSGSPVTIDTTTFCGAFEASLVKLIARFYDKKIGVFISHNSNSPFVDEYMDIEVALCEKYGVPCLDLRKLVSMPRIYSVSGKSDGTSYWTADAVHPNYAAYRDKYLPHIEKWLDSM